MSVTRKALVFLALTFAVSWGVTLGAHFSGLKQSLGAAGGFLILLTMMTGPAIAALICTFAFEPKGQRVDALGLRFRPNLWWLWAFLIPVALAALSVAITVGITSADYVDLGAGYRAAATAGRQDVSQVPAYVFSTPFLLALALPGALINAIALTVTEELGWRGFLHHLWRPTGFWRASLGTGLIWGAWHAPAIVLYGLNYPTQPVLGAAIFVLFCMLLSPIMTLIRDRGGSTWAAGIAHGAINTVVPFTILTLSNADFPWTGSVGIGGFAALALGVLAIAAMPSKKAPAAALAA